MSSFIMWDAPLVTHQLAQNDTPTANQRQERRGRETFPSFLGLVIKFAHPQSECHLGLCDGPENKTDTA